MEQIEKLYIEPTSACNLDCSMCFRHGWIDERIGSMPANIVDRVLEIPAKLPGLKTVMFSGMGEPLVHQRIADMVYAFAQYGISTQLLTNGTMLTTNKAQALIDSGLSMLWVSVDGFERSSYERVHIGSQFDTITKNLEGFNQIRGNCKLGITFVIMKENVDELERINAFADRYHVDTINLSYAVPGAPIKEEDTCYHGCYEVGKQRRVEPIYDYQPQRDYCPFVAENGCFIKWNGDVVPCMQLLHSSYTYFYEEKRKVYYKSFGNIMDADLQTIWSEVEYRDFRSRVLNFEFSDCTYCMGCEDRLENRTDCMYNSFPTCGACLWAQGIGRCP